MEKVKFIVLVALVMPMAAIAILLINSFMSLYSFGQGIYDDIKALSKIIKDLWNQTL
jgi:hypothetical protein